MSLRRLPLLALALAAAVVAIVALTGGGSYQVRLGLANADGLRAGSQVKVGGVPVGTVSSIDLRTGDAVVATLQLDSGQAISPGATAEIVPSDLLGSMYVQLHPGSGPRDPSGTEIPPSRITYPVQLDQVLNVLDASTRARLGILINEAGTALTGRGMDFNQLLSLLPQDFSDGSAMLGQLVSDNHTLGTLIQHAGSFISTLVPARARLTTLIRAADQTMATTAARQNDLRSALALAPGTLASAQRFLAELQATATPLGPAARAITLTAPRLNATLAQVPGFQRAAVPALNAAIDAAPQLTRLSQGATPVLRSADPTVAELASFARSSGPFSTAVGASIDNALGLVEGWARSIQTSDDISHLFHGRALVGPELLRSLLGSLGPATKATASPASAPHAAGHGHASPAPAAASSPAPAPTASSAPAASGPAAGGPVGSLLNGVGHLLSTLTGKQPAGGGGATGTSASATTGGGSSGGHGGSAGNPLGALLGYLLKP